MKMTNDREKTKIDIESVLHDDQFFVKLQAELRKRRAHGTAAIQAVTKELIEDERAKRKVENLNVESTPSPSLSTPTPAKPILRLFSRGTESCDVNPLSPSIPTPNSSESPPTDSLTLRVVESLRYRMGRLSTVDQTKKAIFSSLSESDNDNSDSTFATAETLSSSASTGRPVIYARPSVSDFSGKVERRLSSSKRHSIHVHDIEQSLKEGSSRSLSWVNSGNCGDDEMIVLFPHQLKEKSKSKEAGSPDDK